MKQLPFAVLKGCAYVSTSLYSLHVPSGFGGRDGPDMKTSHISPQGLLAAILLVVGGAVDGGAMGKTRYELRLPL